MADPWNEILDSVCNWASGATDATVASQSLTTHAYDQYTYADVRRTSDEWNGGETFHLGAFLEYGTGQCNDFADFLTCLSNGLGAVTLGSQRSEVWGNPPAFHTKPITSAPQQNPAMAAPTDWNYHEWASSGGVWDASLRLGGTTTALGMVLDTYHGSLVDYGDPGYWNPQPSFIPTIAD